MTSDMDSGGGDLVTPGGLPGTADTEPSIAKKVKLCHRAFQLLCTVVLEASEQENDTMGQMSSHWANDTFDRFKLWSQNIGAHHTGRRSLDYRLRDASNLRAQAINLVGDMVQAMDDAIAIISGARDGWEKQQSFDESDATSLAGSEDEDKYTAEDQATGESPTIAVDSELTQIMMEIVDIIDCLFRLSISVQNPAPHDRFRATTLADTAYEEFDISHVRAKFSSASEDLVERLGKANSHRRQYFRYREDHNRKLACGLEASVNAGQSTVASSIPTHLKRTNMTGNVASFGVLYEDQRSDTGYSQTSFATSTAASGPLRVPSIPEEYNRGSFECPFCLMIVSVSTKAAWKKHVFSDLRPYVCLEPSCQTPHEEYARRHQWFGHLVQAHWRAWSCPMDCEERTWTSADALKSHLLQKHSHALHTNDIEDLVHTAPGVRSLVARKRIALTLPTLVCDRNDPTLDVDSHMYNILPY